MAKPCALPRPDPRLMILNSVLNLNVSKRPSICVPALFHAEICDTLSLVDYCANFPEPGATVSILYQFVTAAGCCA